MPKKSQENELNIDTNQEKNQVDGIDTSITVNLERQRGTVN